jgi:hypothetical protein
MDVRTHENETYKVIISFCIEFREQNHLPVSLKKRVLVKSSEEYFLDDQKRPFQQTYIDLIVKKAIL